MAENSSQRLPIRLTEKTVSGLTLRPGVSDTIIFDEDIGGFGHRIRASGARSWVFQYKTGGRSKRMALGTFPAVSATAARKAAAALYARVKLGGDPAQERDGTRARSGETVGALLRQYLPAKAKGVRPKTMQDIEHALLDLAKPLHGLNVAQVDRRAVAARLTAVTAGAGPVAANRFRTSLSTFFTWAIAQGLIEHNPVTGTAKNPERSRDRVLSDSELVTIWRACESERSDLGPILRLLMLTGARATEIASLQWSEVTDSHIVIPGTRVKNGRPLVIPLTGLVRSILDARPRATDDYVFGRRAGRPFSGWGLALAKLNARIAETAGAPLAHWTPHDIRRSVATGLAELGQPPHIVELILNHAGHRSGVAGIYNRSQYQREKLAALTMWGDHLLGAVEGKPATVVPFPGAAP
jgi:integrase